MESCKHIIIAEDGFGSMNDEAVAIVDTLDEAREFVANPPAEWRGHVRSWPYGLAVYEAHRLDEEELR